MRLCSKKTCYFRIKFCDFEQFLSFFAYVTRYYHKKVSFDSIYNIKIANTVLSFEIQDFLTLFKPYREERAPFFPLCEYF